MSDEETGIFDMTVPTTMMVYLYKGVSALVSPAPYIDPDTGKERGDPRFGAEFLFAADHPDLLPLKKLAAQMAQAKWPGLDLSPAARKVKFPFANGNQRAADRKAKGKDGSLTVNKAILKASSKYAPMVSWIENGKLTEIVSTDLANSPALGKFFSGAECLATFKFVTTEIKDKDAEGGIKRYVSAYLNKVFSTGKGTRVGGGRSAAEAFKGYIGQSTTEDPTAGDVGDDIPF